MSWRSSLLLAAALLASGAGAAASETGALFREHCASCHGSARLGGIGPALIPENLGRLKRDKAQEVIGQGRPATQMPGFAETLNEDQIAALVDLVYTPLPEMPSWGMAEIDA